MQYDFLDELSSFVTHFENLIMLLHKSIQVIVFQGCALLVSPFCLAWSRNLQKYSTAKLVT